MGTDGLRSGKHRAERPRAATRRWLRQIRPGKRETAEEWGDAQVPLCQVLLFVDFKGSEKRQAGEAEGVAMNYPTPD